MSGIFYLIVIYGCSLDVEFDCIANPIELSPSGLQVTIRILQGLDTAEKP